MSSLLGSNCTNPFLWRIYLLQIVNSFWQSSLRLLSSSWVTCSGFAICWRLPTLGSWKMTLTLSHSGRCAMNGEGSSHSLCTLAEREESAVAIRWCFVRKSWNLVGLSTTTLNYLIRNVLKMPVVAVHAGAVPHRTSETIRISRFTSVVTMKMPSDLAGFSVASPYKTDVRKILSCPLHLLTLPCSWFF